MKSQVNLLSKIHNNVRHPEDTKNHLPFPLFLLRAFSPLSAASGQSSKWIKDNILITSENVSRRHEDGTPGLQYVASVLVTMKDTEPEWLLDIIKIATNGGIMRSGNLQQWHHGIYLDWDITEGKIQLHRNGNVVSGYIGPASHNDDESVVGYVNFCYFLNSEEVEANIDWIQSIVMPV